MISSRPSSWVLAALLVLLPLASCSFSLNDIVKDWWYYVDNHLASTTSQACLDAYNAAIDCDQTLLGIVSSNSPNFNPGPEDLERTCVPACSGSLETWVQNVKSACTASGDGALVSTNLRPLPLVPVAVVGEIFQYEYAFACSKNISGWCYFNYPASPEWAREDFTCSNECASQFFEDAHDLPGSNYTFRIYDLEERSDWWKNQWSEGYDHLLKCRKGEVISDGPLPTTTTTSSDDKTTSTTSSVGHTSTSTRSTGHSSPVVITHTSPSSSATASSTSGSAIASTTSSSNAARLLPYSFLNFFW